MTIRNKAAVQMVRSQVVTFDIADLPLGVFVPLFDVPQGAIVKGGCSHVLEAAGGTTNVLDFGTAASPNALLNDDDARALGATAFTGVNLHYPAGAKFGVTRTETGTASTTGKFLAILDYQITGAVDEVYG